MKLYRKAYTNLKGVGDVVGTWCRFYHQTVFSPINGEGRVRGNVAWSLRIDESEVPFWRWVLRMPYGANSK